MCYSCQSLENNLDDNCEIYQEYINNYLYTKAEYKDETIWQQYDEINLNTSDSIKLIRYKEAEQWILKFKNIDKLNQIK